MHSCVYEVSSSPVPQEKRTRHSNLPEWFHSICDYADDLSPEQRTAAIQSFAEFFHGNCTIEDDKITFSQKAKLTIVDYTFQQLMVVNRKTVEDVCSVGFGGNVYAYMDGESIVIYFFYV